MKLYVVDSPYWYWVMRRHRNAPGSHVVQSTDPLDEHHTYFYHLFLKYGIVDEVVIYSNRQELDREEAIPASVECFGGRMRLDYDPDRRQLKQDSGQLLYCRQPHRETAGYGNHLQIVKLIADGFPVDPRLSWLPFHVPGLCRPRNLDPVVHDIVVAEGPYNLRFVNRGVASLVWPSLSAQGQYVERTKKDIDWIIVGSFGPRKRVVRWCEMLLRQDLGRLRGTLLMRYPKNSREMQEYDRYRELIDGKLNVELVFTATCRQKIRYLCRSRVFISPAEEDSGPRSVIEAGQAGVPVLAMSSHGSASYLVRAGRNGELVRRFGAMPGVLRRMLDSPERYDCAINEELLDEKRCFEPVADLIASVRAKRRFADR